MSRLIDADALELILNNAIDMMRTMAKALDSEDDPEIQMEIKAYTDILNGVKEQPTIDERKTGRWIPQDHNKIHGNVTTCMYYYPVCSECGHTGDFGMNYCPNCGSYNGGGA